jgi:PAS domain S-box-containing protein
MKPAGKKPVPKPKAAPRRAASNAAIKVKPAGKAAPKRPAKDAAQALIQAAKAQAQAPKRVVLEPQAPGHKPPSLLSSFGRLLALVEDGGNAPRRELAQVLLKEALQMADCAEGSLMLGHAQHLRLEAVQGLSAEVWAAEGAALENSAARRALERGDAVEHEDAFGHGLALPLLTGAEPLGVLLLTRPWPFTAAQRHDAARSAANLALVLASLQPLLRRRSDAQRLAAIAHAGAALQKDHEVLAVLDRIAREAEALLGGDASAVFLLQPDGGLQAPVATGPGGERLSDLKLAPGEGLAGWVVREGRPLLVEDATHDPRFAQRMVHSFHQAAQCVAAVPVLLDGRVLGVLEVLKRRAGNGFTVEDLPALQALAVLAGVAIENARAVEGLLERARRLDAEVARNSVEANESRRKLEGVLFAMEDAVLAADENGIVTLLNRAAQFLSFGLTGEDAVGQALPELFPGPAFLKAMGNVREWLMPVNAEIDLGPSDARATYAVVIAPIRDLEGYLTGFVVVLRDITRFRELERMKTAFLNTVSHELRTPITSIRAFSELMTRQDADPLKVKEWSRVINEESERLNRLVDDLLDISRIESGKKLSVVRKPTQLKPLFERAIAMQSGTTTTHPIKFSFNEDLTLAELDQDRIQQVVMNLLSNAIKYSPQGGDVDLSVDFSPPDKLRVEVQDHGLGMKEEDRAHVFEKFFRVEGAHMSGIRGTGLGLSICKYLVEAHGGKIGVDTVLGKGSTFWFELPLFSGEAAPA